MFGAFHLTLSLIAAAVILTFANLGIATFSTPAGLGAFELSTLAAFRLFSVDYEIAVSYAIALHIIEVGPMVLFGLLVLSCQGVYTLKVDGSPRVECGWC